MTLASATSVTTPTGHGRELEEKFVSDGSCIMPAESVVTKTEQQRAEERDGSKKMIPSVHGEEIIRGWSADVHQ